MGSLRYKNFNEFQNYWNKSKELQNLFMEHPEKFQEVELIDPMDRPWVFIRVIYLLGAAVVLSIIFIAWITLSDPQEIATINNGVKIVTTQVRKIPEVLSIIVTSSITAIAGLLAPSPLNSTKN